MAYKYVFGVSGVVIDTGSLAWVPITEPTVVAAIAAGQVLPADGLVAQKSAIRIVEVEDFRTTDAVQAMLVSWALAVQTLYTARFTVTAIDVGNADTRAWHATASAKRVNGGALLVGAPSVVTSHADAGAGTWGLAADVSGNDFRVRVTGAAGRTISWSLVGEVVRARPDGLVD